ncbi:hypothetical protein LCGC14_2161460 [marine sediment metagenome]|uniref:Uncharacterized protein n=1 Tax=marine sediment metagenome TaxID=412755 RepID=A0A0F9DST6_9ZZZZ
MMTICNPVICDERRGLIEHGGILAFVQTDHVVRFWLGDGQGVDYLAGEVRAQDGSRFLFGRIRYHQDDKIFGSEDHKVCSSLGAGPGLPDSTWSQAVEAMTALTAFSGIGEVHEVLVDGDVMKFFEIFKSRAPDLGYRLGITEREMKEDSP